MAPSTRSRTRGSGGSASRGTPGRRKGCSSRRRATSATTCGTARSTPTTMAVLARNLRNVAHQVAAALHNTHQHITYGLPDGYQWTLPDNPAKPVGGPSPGRSTVHHAASPRFAGRSQELVRELQQAAAAQPPESPPPAKRARVAPAGPGGADVALLPPRPLSVKIEGNAQIML